MEIKLNKALDGACDVALRQCMGVKEGETVVIITDEPKRNIGYPLWMKAKELNTDAIYIETIPREIYGEEPPNPVAEAMKVADVVIAPTSKSITHTTAKKEACERGTRVATILDRGEEVHIMTELGTDLSFLIEGRKAERSTGVYRNPSECGNLPEAEAYITPVEGTANGTVIIDGSMAGIGILETPIKLTIKDSFAEKIEEGDEARKLEEILSKYGKEARNMAEFGVGTNPNAKISGNILEGEKVFGTIHIALGSNYDFGGQVKTPIHLDGIIKKPTVVIDGEYLFRKGILQGVRNGE